MTEWSDSRPHTLPCTQSKLTLRRRASIIGITCGVGAFPKPLSRAMIPHEAGSEFCRNRSPVVWRSWGNHVGQFDRFGFYLRCAALMGSAALSATGQPCEPAWAEQGELPGLTNPENADRDIGRAWAVFDDGSGPDLYSGGLFTHAGDLEINGLARWDRIAWSEVGGGVTGVDGVYALVVHDDGAGDALYVAGSFTHAGGVPANNVAKWDGTKWSALWWGFRGGVPHTIVYALAVFDDGTGPAVFAGGRFIESLNILIRGVGKWNGTTWESTNSLLNEKVNALAVFDDGTGPALYAGGLFSVANGVETIGIAKYDGASWSAVGGGVGGSLPHVRSLCVFDDGTGRALYVGGQFDFAGGQHVSKVAKWDGQNWSRLGCGLDAWVTSMQVFDDGSGEALYAAGKFSNSGPFETNYIAKWNPTTQSWGPVGSGVDNNVYALAVFDDGQGPDLYVNGRFVTAGDEPVNSVGKRNGCLQLPANLDADGDLDLDDVRHFIPCMTGPGGTVETACERGDVDGDADIDLQDFGGVQTGPFQTRRTH